MRSIKPPLLLIMAALTAACGSDEVAEAEAAAHEVVDSTVEGARALQRTSQRALDEVGSELDELRTRLEGVADEGEQQVDTTVDRLNREYRELERRVARLTEQGGEDLERAEESLRGDLAQLEYDLEMARLEARETKSEFTTYVDASIDRLDGEIRGLQAVISTEAGEVDAEVRESLQEAEQTVEQIERDLAGVQAASEEEFEELRAEIARKVAELRRELRELELGLSA